MTYKMIMEVGLALSYNGTIHLEIVLHYCLNVRSKSTALVDTLMISNSGEYQSCNPQLGKGIKKKESSTKKYRSRKAE